MTCRLNSQRRTCTGEFLDLLQSRHLIYTEWAIWKLSRLLLRYRVSHNLLRKCYTTQYRKNVNSWGTSYKPLVKPRNSTPVSSVSVTKSNDPFPSYQQEKKHHHIDSYSCGKNHMVTVAMAIDKFCKHCDFTCANHQMPRRREKKFSFAIFSFSDFKGCFPFIFASNTHKILYTQWLKKFQLSSSFSSVMVVLVRWVIVDWFISLSGLSRWSAVAVEIWCNVLISMIWIFCLFLSVFLLLLYFPNTGAVCLLFPFSAIWIY